MYNDCKPPKTPVTPAPEPPEAAPQEAKLQTIAALVQAIMHALGEDINRPGLAETPARTAKMLCEMLEGVQYTNAQIAEMFGKCFEYSHSGDLVLVKHIPIFSFCEHHFALMYNMRASIAYIPAGKVLGLSKIARIAAMAAKRFQLQERIGSDIAEIMQLALDTEDVMVVIEGEHSCMTARGISSDSAKTRTNTFRGVFGEAARRAEVLGQL